LFSSVMASWRLACARQGGHDTLLYGRGASAESMLGLAEVFGQPDGAAPQAPGGSWYSYSFPCADRSERAAAAVEKLVEELGGQGFGAERLALLGFSQGGYLALEFAARNARRYAPSLA
jgi:phospholipase/carboxylesterase